MWQKYSPAPCKSFAHNFLSFSQTQQIGHSHTVVLSRVASLCLQIAPKSQQNNHQQLFHILCSQHILFPPLPISLGFFNCNYLAAGVRDTREHAAQHLAAMQLTSQCVSKWKNTSTQPIEDNRQYKHQTLTAT